MDTDVLHTPGDDREWNESFYFNVYDKGNDVCMFMRIGLKPNMDERSVFCFIMMPDGSLVGIKDTERLGDPSLNAKALRFEIVEAEKRWKISFKGHLGKMGANGPIPISVNFSLTFDARNAIFDYRECVSGESERIAQKVASEHLEQFGKVSGTLLVGSERFEISGTGERDHSWGVRDWNAPRMWIWLTAQFSEVLAFNLTKLFVDEGEVTAGFVHEGGRNIPIVGAQVSTVLENDGSPRSLELLMTDKNGIEYRASATVLKVARMPFPGRDGKKMSVMHETLAEYQFKGRTGYGIAEYLNREK